jgi:hypothetical protein
MVQEREYIATCASKEQKRTEDEQPPWRGGD